jgi:hypothetical protein
VFKFDEYAVSSPISFGSIIAMRVRPLFLGCLEKDGFDGIVIVLSFTSGMQLIIVIFMFG